MAELSSATGPAPAGAPRAAASAQAERRARSLGGASAAAAAALGVVVALDQLALAGATHRLVQPGFATSAASTGLLFALAGVALWRHHDAARGVRRALALSGGAVMLLACAVALARAAGVDVGEVVAGDSKIFMSQASASLFVLLAVTMLLLTRPSAWRGFVWVVTPGLALSGVGALGALFDAEHFYASPFFEGLAPATAIGFLGLFVSALLARPNDGWTALLVRDDDIGARTRLLLTVSTLAPTAIAAVLLALTKSGALAPDLRLSYLVVLSTLVLAGVVMRAATLEAAVRAERERSIADLRQALADREVLLGEVYHRVKNNLQQVNAMLMLEAMTVTDAAAQAVFAQTADRVRAMGAVHEMLMTSATLDRVDGADFLRRLCDGLESGLGLKRRNVALILHADPGALDIDRASALALLINELVSNAIKHAFPHGRAGEITVLHRQGEGGFRLQVSDDGVGLPPGNTADGGLGSTILRALVQQLRAEMTVTSDRGLTVTVVGPTPPTLAPPPKPEEQDG